MGLDVPIKQQEFFADFTDVTLEPSDTANKAIQGNVAMQLTSL